ncbi:hypothetical protein QTV49_001756 [Vibrio vulnificus]|nr:hypothetical protein [Vibrio vulnificus]
MDKDQILFAIKNPYKTEDDIAFQLELRNSIETFNQAKDYLINWYQGGQIVTEGVMAGMTLSVKKMCGQLSLAIYPESKPIRFAFDTKYGYDLYDCWQNSLKDNE